MNHRANLIIAGLIASLLTLQAATALAQPSAQDRARQALAEAQAHEDAQRHALAAQRFLELYDLMREAQLPRAPIALWSAGFNLRQVPGRELEALETLRRFLDTSTTLSADVEIQGFRSDSVGLIAELEARAPQSSGQDLGPEASARSAQSDSDSISPVGPIILSVGGATLVAGLVVAGILATENDSLFAMCVDGLCPPSARPAAESVQALATVTDILLVSGAVVAATGLLLTLLLQDGPEDSPTIAAGCGPSECNLQLQGSF